MCDQKKYNDIQNYLKNVNFCDDNEIFDNRDFISKDSNAINNFITDEIPNKITGTYIQDYNILYVNDIIVKKLQYEKYTLLDKIKQREKELELLLLQPQKFLFNKITEQELMSVKSKIKSIESGDNIKKYKNRVDDIIKKYKEFKNPVKTYIFDIDNKSNNEVLTNKQFEHIKYIENYLNIAKDYIDINVSRIVETSDINLCKKCGSDLSNLECSEEGSIVCPNNDCQSEYKYISFEKMSKDNLRINNSAVTEDESIDNFIKAFIRYQGLQHDIPSKSIYFDLDNYFITHDFPTSDKIKQLPLNSKGRRGDTNHKMLWDALSNIGKSEYYEHTNLIGHNYWGWTLPNVMHLKDKLIDKYNKTQKVFYQIPQCEKERDSSLGTQYRLWRHLQLEGYQCYMDEFKIAENIDSIRIHNKLWKLMCDGCNDPDIYFIL
jgi:hypothetical protein